MPASWMDCFPTPLKQWDLLSKKLFDPCCKPSQWPSQEVVSSRLWLCNEGPDWPFINKVILSSTYCNLFALSLYICIHSSCHSDMAHIHNRHILQHKKPQSILLNEPAHKLKAFSGNKLFAFWFIVTNFWHLDNDCNFKCAIFPWSTYDVW